MAMAPSRLREFILANWVGDDVLIQSLRKNGLIRSSLSNEDLIAVFERARDELAGEKRPRAWGAPSRYERACIHLRPFLTLKGRAWAVPLKSLRWPWWMLVFFG